VARLNLATLASLALAPAPPANVRISLKLPENASTLVWESSPGGRAVGYELLWRDTTSPDWEHVQAMGNVTQYTSSVSKDNEIFAIRSVDKAGHRSLAVVPSPEH